MSIVRIILLGLTFYFLYKLVFSLIIPVYRTTKNVRRGFQDMQSRMNDYQQQSQGPKQQPHKEETPKNNGSGKVGEYIDFEEVK